MQLGSVIIQIYISALLEIQTQILVTHGEWKILTYLFPLTLTCETQKAKTVWGKMNQGANILAIGMLFQVLMFGKIRVYFEVIALPNQ